MTRSFRNTVLSAVLFTILTACGSKGPLSRLGISDTSTLQFDADGNLSNPETIAALTEKLSASPHLLLVYVHGWKHSADPDDANFVAFQEHLSEFKASARSTGSTLPILGVYVTWNARKLPGEFENLAYYGTRSSADTLVQRGVLSDSLTALSRAAKTQPTARVVLTGHSMGSRILGRSIQKRPGLVSSADLILLVNAADDEDSGSRTITAIDGILGGAARTPRVIWLTSSGDTATLKVFKFAERKVAIGHSERLRTHQFVQTELGRSSAAMGIAFQANGTYWRLANANRPFSGGWWNIQVPTRIIADHGDILGPVFRQAAQAVYLYAVFPRGSLEELLRELNNPDNSRRLAAANHLYQFANTRAKATGLIDSLAGWRTKDRQAIINHLELIRYMPTSVFEDADLRQKAILVFGEIRDSGQQVIFLEEAERAVFGA